MSNLLERAIVDAKALKEAALKNAEQLVIEKYSQEIKEAMDQILEKEEDETLFEQDTGLTDMFGDLDTPEQIEQPQPGAEEDNFISDEDLEAELPDAFRTDDEEMIRIQLNSLDDDYRTDTGLFGGDDELEDEEISIDIEDDDAVADTDFDMDAPQADTDLGIDVASDSPISAAALEEMIADALKDTLNEEEEEINEEEELEEEIDLDELMERVRVDFEPQKSGWAGTPEKIMQEYESMLLAREQDSEVKEENEELRKNVAALQKENKTLSSATIKLQDQNKKFSAAFETLQEKLETMNVSNAKLLYINQALENASLNERQKRKIVEAISKAGTVQEAKIVFETMNDTVATTSDVKKDRTLSEVVSRKSSLLVAARKEQPKQDANPLFNRMQTLAGIKTK